jgi:MFS family permease
MRYAKDPQTDRSLQHSLRDGVAYAAMAGGGETYFSAFALFLKARAPQVALLGTLPPLLGALGQLLSAWLGTRLRRRLPLILAGAGLQALSWLPLLLLPLGFPQHAVPLLLVCLVLYYGGANLAAPQWTSLMGDLVPERRRGRFFARRTRLTSATSFLALAAGGTLLHLFDVRGHTALGFVVVFLTACAARWVSVYHLSRMQEPSVHAATRNPAGHWLQTMRGTGAPWFSLYFLMMQGAVGIASPLFAVYMLRDLDFSYLQFMANTGTAVLVQFLTLNTWGRISDVFGNRLILQVTGMLVPFLPLLWVVSDQFVYLLLLQCLSGLAWAGFSLAAGNLLYDLVPAPYRATYAAFHNVATALGVFIGGMIGAALIPLLPALHTWLGDPALSSTLLSVFLVSSGARLLVAVLLLRRVRELRRPRRSLSAGAFVFRATRFNAFLGVVYEWVALLRPDDRQARGKPLDPPEP